MSKHKIRSPTLDLITRVREARATLSDNELYRVALDALEEGANLGTGSQGLLLTLLRDIFEEAVFSNAEYSSTNGKHSKVAHVTLAERSRHQLDWAQSDVARLKTANLELQEQNGLCRAECEAAKEELRNELSRQSRASMRIDHLEDRLKSQKKRAKMMEDETQSSFVSLTTHSEELRHRLSRSHIVVKELAAYRDKLESVRVRFRRLSTEHTAGELNKDAEPRRQIDVLVAQLRGLYFDYFSKFEETRTNLTHTPEHIQNMKREFARDAGALIQEKERLSVHTRNELSTDEEKKLRCVTGDLHVQTLRDQLHRLRQIRGGLWECYAHLCEHFMQHGTTSLNAVHPPTWAHPIPSHANVYQDILGIYTTIGPNLDPLTICTSAAVTNFLGGMYISFSDAVISYFVKAYGNERLAIAAMHSFLIAVTNMRKEGSTRIAMFCRALGGTVSIFSIWSYVEALRSVVQIKEQLILNSNFDRNQAVHLLYGDFASLAEMVDVENHLTVYVRKFISEEEEIGFTMQSKEEDEEKEEEKEERNNREDTVDGADCGGGCGKDGGGTEGNELCGHDMLMEFLCGQLISGSELRVRRSMSALSARDLVNSGHMRLTRFQDAVVGMWTRSKKISRKGITRMYRAIVFETHAVDMWAHIANKLSTQEEQQHQEDEFHEKNKDATDEIKVTDVEAMKHLMGMEVPIDCELAQLLAYLTWTMVPSHSTWKHAMDEFVEVEKKKEDELGNEVREEVQQLDASKGVRGANKVTVVKHKLKPGRMTVT